MLGDTLGDGRGHTISTPLCISFTLKTYSSKPTSTATRGVQSHGSSERRFPNNQTSLKITVLLWGSKRDKQHIRQEKFRSPEADALTSLKIQKPLGSGHSTFCQIVC